MQGNAGVAARSPSTEIIPGGLFSLLGRTGENAAIFSPGRQGPQAGFFRSGQVEAVEYEFHADGDFGGSGEKFREGIPQGDGHDLFAWSHGA